MDFDAIARQIMLNHVTAYPDPLQQTMGNIVNAMRAAFLVGRESMAEDVGNTLYSLSSEYMGKAAHAKTRTQTGELLDKAEAFNLAADKIRQIPAKYQGE